MTALTVQHLSKTYKNGQTALNDVSFSVEKGDFFALLGPNGAGKTTLIGILTSLVQKTSGTATIFGHDIDHEFSLAKQHVGVVPQEFNMSIFGKVHRIVMNQAGYYGLPRKLVKERTEKYLTRLGLWEKRNTEARHLSGGMKRRLMIARALLHEPRLLILDEPTAGVDIEIRRDMWNFLREINEQGTTIILTTHYLEEAESLCKNIAIIDEGKIIEYGKMENVLDKLQQETFILSTETTFPENLKLSGFEYKQLSERSISVDIDRTKNLNELFRELNKCDIQITSMRNKSNRLEELFLKLTTGEK